MNQLRRSFLSLALLSTWARLSLPLPVLAAEPVIGVETAVAVPTSESRRGASTGGAIGLSAGYRFPLASYVAIDLTTGPGFTVLETRCIRDSGVPAQCDGDDTTSLFAWTAGPRIVLIDGGLEIFAGVRGGYYHGLSGRIEADAAGFAIETGLQYDLVPGTSIGAIARREQVDIEPSPEAGGDFEFLAFGLGFQHRFGAEP